MPDNNNQVPLYYQVEEYIREQIENGVFKPGEMIPTEIELQKKFDVSRTTVRKAVDRLVMAGKLKRIQGKGTFVKNRKFERVMTHISSFTEEIKNEGMIPSTRILNCVEKDPSPFIKNRLKLKDDEKVVKYDRLRYADQNPISILYIWVPSKLVPGFVSIEKSESFYRDLNKHYNIVPVNADEMVEASLPSKQEADLLEIRDDAPVLSITRISYDENNRPLEFVKGVIRGDLWKYHAKLRTRAKGEWG